MLYASRLHPITPVLADMSTMVAARTAQGLAVKVNGQAQTASSSLLRTSLAGRVMEVLPNGYLVVEAVRIAPNDVEALANLGAGLEAQGKLVEAIEYYRKAEQNMNKPGGAFLYADVYAALGSALLRQGKLEQAAAYLETFLNVACTNRFVKLPVNTSGTRPSIEATSSDEMLLPQKDII
jgi:tetratricopeptide (TPR) repeat protein